MKSYSWVDRLLRNCSIRAAERGVPFTLTSDMLTQLWSDQLGKCFWFGINLKTTDESFDPHEPARVSVDRLDNEKGYVKSNVVLCCVAANMGRGRAPVTEFRRFCDELCGQLRNS